MRTGSALALLLAFAVVGCDPCASPTGCTDRAQFTMTGRILQEETAMPAVGVSVDFIRTGGAVLDTDSARAFTNEDGVFTLRVSGESTGLVTGDVVVRSAAGAANPFEYRVVAQTLRVFADVGDANVLPVWSTRPTLPDIAMLVDAGVPPEELKGLQVEFRRTSGIQLREGDVFRTVTRDGGVFALFDRSVQPVDAGEIVGDLFIGFNNLVLRDVRVVATPEFRRNPILRLVDVTP